MNAPTHVKRPGSAATRPGRKSDSPGGRINNKTIPDRRELQGISTARHASQRPPRWRAPPGSAALIELQRLFAPAPRWAVIVKKQSTGTEVVFSVFDAQSDATSASRRLNSFGLESRVEQVRDSGVVPGASVRPR